MLQYQCPRCGGLFQVDPKTVGGQAACPNCHGTVAIAQDRSVASGAAVAPENAAADQLQQLNCPICQRVFRVPTSILGQQVLCPHCQGCVIAQDGTNASQGVDVPGPSEGASTPVVGHTATRVGDAQFGRPGEGQRPEPTTPKTSAPAADEVGPAGTTPSAPLHSDRHVEAYVPPTVRQITKPASSDMASESSVDPMAPTAARSETSAEQADEREAVPISEAPSREGLIQVHDKPRTVRYGDEEVELHQLTPEEKAKRRLIKNAVVIVVGILILLTYILFHVGYWPFSR